MSSITKLYKYIFLISFEQKRKILYIAALKLRVNFVIKYLPLKAYYYKYFMNHYDQKIDLSPYQEEISFIKKVLRNLPFSSSCLQESIVVHLYFRNKGIIIPLLLGVSAKNQFIAHAWIDFEENNDFIKLVNNGQRISGKIDLENSKDQKTKV